jgi:hypothetical protein
VTGSQLETSNVVMVVYQNNPLPKCCAIDDYVHVALNRKFGLEAHELDTGLPMVRYASCQLNHGRH